jgi:hypothetical protein
LSYALLNESLIFTSTFYIEVTFLCWSNLDYSKDFWFWVKVFFKS